MDPFSTLGWIGAALVLAAYILIQLGKVNANDLAYDLMNLVGGTSIAINLFHTKSYGPMVLNIVWAVVAAVGLVVFVKKRTKTNHTR